MNKAKRNSIESQSARSVLPDREDIHTEFKEARAGLPENLCDTLCAFLNTDGGTLYLGVSDISNIISHREYRDATPARLMIYQDRVVLDNPAMAYFHTRITPQNLRSHPKNPAICKFMIQIGRFDQLGSGVLNIHKYWPIFSPNTEPIFRETPHGFELILPLPESRLESGLESRLESAPVEAPVEALVEALVELAETEKKIVVALSTNMLGKKDLLGLLDYRQATGNYKKSINKLLQAGLIERTLPDKPNSRFQKYRLTEKGRLATVRVKDRP